jgi:predicted ABC-type ATPase
MMPYLYIIAGCNGAGKTTASFTLLPKILGVTEFVNADEIARGLSPFNPEGVSFEAGRIMLARINELLNQKKSFAFETTLATRSYVSLIKKAQKMGYKVHLLFLWLNSEELAIKRVKQRVKNGGHNIPVDVIRRRYKSGISNLKKLYIPIADTWVVYNNTHGTPAPIVYGNKKGEIVISDNLLYKRIIL